MGCTKVSSHIPCNEGQILLSGTQPRLFFSSLNLVMPVVADAAPHLGGVLPGCQHSTSNASLYFRNEKEKEMQRSERNEV